jgi:colanic acid/amylovoran biosynthesis glycosyltransferase
MRPLFGSSSRIAKNFCQRISSQTFDTSSVATRHMNNTPQKTQELTLVLFTGSYPYDVAAEQTFLDPEVECLVANFDQVVVVPGNCTGQKSAVPDGVQVEESYAEINQPNSGRARKVFRALLSRLFYQELFARPSILFQPFSLKRLIAFVSQAVLTKGWVGDFIARRKFDVSQAVFYTYWLDAGTTGVGMAKKSYPGLVLVSRAHGADLYEERYTPAYIPCRRQSLRNLDRLFPDSEAGREYISGRYPWFAPSCEVGRLGVTDPGFVTPSSQDGVFRIVSCSFIVPVKRVDLILRGIEYAARLRPAQQFEWHHFGTGPLKQALEETARTALPVNVKSYFPGYSSIEHLMQFYRTNPIDVFLNVSETEGTPVSVMEAISCSIPVIATAVGGNPEIVSEQNGNLLSPNPTPAEIAASIFSILDNPGLAEEKRKGSRRVWQEKYDADSNFQAFATRLKSIRADT